MEIESKIKEYNKKISLAWKQESHDLLMEAWNDRVAFEKVLLEMVGKNGNVLRSVKKTEQHGFCSRIFENREAIKGGTFNIFSLNGICSKNPLSYISKICHIINPKAYPLIWDSHVMKKLRINYRRDRWDEKVAEERERVANLSEKEAYENESAIWADA